jgi:4a-hydroxytetrahydrobiopterin dehydratase
MSDLAGLKCIPCRGGVPPMRPDEYVPLLNQLSGWEVIQNHHLQKHYAFPDFVSALGFVNRIGELAEREGHHPDLLLAWGRVGVQIWTHKLDGLSEADFILAAKIDALPREPEHV